MGESTTAKSEIRAYSDRPRLRRRRTVTWFPSRRFPSSPIDRPQRGDGRNLLTQHRRSHHKHRDRRGHRATPSSPTAAYGHRRHYGPGAPLRKERFLDRPGAYDFEVQSLQGREGFRVMVGPSFVAEQPQVSTGIWVLLHESSLASTMRLQDAAGGLMRTQHCTR